MALDFEVERVENCDFNTCGEITALLSVGKREFFLNCKYCDYSCLKLEDFIQHIYDDHLDQFIDSSLQQLDTLEPIEDMETSDKSVRSFEKNDDESSVLTYLEKVEIYGTDEINNDFNTKEPDSEEVLCEESLEDQTIEFDDADVELLVETSEYTDSDSEISSTRQHNLWEKQFDLPEHDKKAYFLKQEAKKKFIIELIEVYRSLPALWKLKRNSYYSRKIKTEQYEILLKKYKEKYPSATQLDVIRKIQCLRASYRRELKRVGPSGISTLYYFDALSFLGDNIPRSDSPNKTLLAASQRMTKKFIRPPSLLNDENLINLAKIYKKHACLWDENDIAYRFANRRREAMKTILDEINKTAKLKLKLTKFDLEKEISLLRKLCSNEKKEKIACKRSKLLYKPACPYFEHIAYLEPDVTPYECSICDKVFFGVCQYKIHEASHDGSLPFKCKVCERGFKLATNLTVHLRRHVLDYTYSCEVCGKPCATTTELKTHMRSHTGERPYVCDICGKNYQSFSQFSRHMKRHGGKPKFKCEICSRPFYDKRGVLEHMTVHTKVRDQMCNVCNKGFATLKHLRQHELIHNPEKKYECEICGKRFAQAAGLNGHMKSHGTKFTTNDAGAFIFE